jgi:hypothetical protein
MKEKSILTLDEMEQRREIFRKVFENAEIKVKEQEERAYWEELREKGRKKFLNRKCR